VYQISITGKVYFIDNTEVIGGRLA